MRPTKNRLEQQLSSLCGETTSREAGTFVRKCREWLKLEKNQDRRGTTAGAIGKAYYASLWFKEAQRAQAHEDSSVRRMAKKVVRGSLHKEFPQIRKDLAKLHGEVSKAGKRIADQRARAAERAIDLDGQFALRELRSMASAKPVGQYLRNCLARKSDARNYVKRARDGEIELWVLVKQERPVCLIQIDSATREIDELEGKNGSTPKLKRRLAIALLDKLDMSGDDEETFAAIGALSAFRHGRPVVDPVKIEGTSYWIWILRDGSEIVIASKGPHDERKGWSRFTRRTEESNGDSRRGRRRLWAMDHDDGARIVGGLWNALCEGDVLELVLGHPSFAEKLREGLSRKRAEAAMP